MTALPTVQLYLHYAASTSISNSSPTAAIVQPNPAYFLSVYSFPPSMALQTSAPGQSLADVGHSILHMAVPGCRDADTDILALLALSPGGHCDQALGVPLDAVDHLAPRTKEAADLEGLRSSSS